MLFSPPFPSTYTDTKIKEDLDAGAEAEKEVEQAEKEIGKEADALRKAIHELEDAYPKTTPAMAPPIMPLDVSLDPMFAPLSTDAAMASVFRMAAATSMPVVVVTHTPDEIAEKEKTEEEALERVQKAVDSRDKLVQGMIEGLPGNGAWGVSRKMCWHSGVHLRASAGNSTELQAIADGVLVYSRESELSKSRADDKNAPLRYMGATDNGCVVLRHTIEIGEGDNATNITFYSIAMHLDKLALYKEAGKPEQYSLGEIVPRNTKLGMPGHIYGQTYQTHFELVCDTENLTKLLGRKPGEKLKTGSNGRTDAVYGDTHFYIKAGAEVFDAKDIKEDTYAIQAGDTPESVAGKHGASLPEFMNWKKKGSNHRNAKYVTAMMDGDSLKFDWIRDKKGNIVPKAVIVFKKPERVFKTAQDLVVTMRFENGDCIMETTREFWPYRGDWFPITKEPKDSIVTAKGYEYTLMNDAKKIVSAYEENLYKNTKYVPGQKKKWQSISAVYELLRFGRVVVGPDQLREPEKIKHFREIVYNMNGDTGYINLNDPGKVTVYSDADFPEFCGWNVIQDDNDGNSRCDSPKVFHWLEDFGEPIEKTRLSKGEKLKQRESRLDHPFFMRRIGKVFLRIPADWDAGTVDQRWGWLKTQEALDSGLAAPMTEENYRRLQEHNKKMAFWEELKQGNEKANIKIQQLETEYKKYNETIQNWAESNRTHSEAMKQYEIDEKEYNEKLKQHNKHVKDYENYIKAIYKKEGPVPEAVAMPGDPPKAPRKPEKPEYPKDTLLPPAPQVPFTINPSDCWHLPPRMFIMHMRKCMWLDRRELAEIYLDRDYSGNIKDGYIKDSPNKIRERYRKILNKLMQKYMVVTPTRMAHFLGQGGHESSRMGVMLERTNKGKASVQPETGGWYNDPADIYFDGIDVPKKSKQDYRFSNGNQGTHEKEQNGVKVIVRDSIKFRGRGFKQVTGRSNYAGYWNYRGWLRERMDYDWHWWDNSKKKPAVIDDPQRISVNDYEAIDASCWYWIGGRSATINKRITEGNNVSDSLIESVTRAINGAVNGLDDRQTVTKRADKVLMRRE
ncbi:MAG: M23 family metallopeptidase [Betaproteobacteria bacterium]|nr:M23 family metallopeptidase [Betaproteobacteria bacterium]